VENLFGWNPERYEGNDYNTWNWGGNLIVHEIVQKTDGSLMAKLPDTVDRVFANRQSVSFVPGIGHWRIDGDALSADSPYSFACAVTSEKMPDPAKLSAKLTFTESTRGIGMMLRTNENFDKAYYVKLEPQRNRLVFRSAIMQSEDGGKTFPYEAELERPIELVPGKPYKMKVIADGTICKVYVNDEVAMSARIYDIQEGQFGLFVVEGSATFQDVEVAAL
jgi:beta-fructofuranosidase